jgi:hypothetical protein
VIETEREIIERRLVAAFDAVKPLDPCDLPLFAPFKRGGFMPSLLGFMLYANGYSLRGTSRANPNGLIYADGETLFAIGIFRKTLESREWHVTISGPWGANGFAKVHQFVERLRSIVSVGDVYVRHLPEDVYRVFLGNGYLPIDARPWHDDAPSEDETHHHKSILLADILDIRDGRAVGIRTLKGQEHRGFRIKARMAFNRFGNFLDRNGLRLAIRDYSVADRDEGEALVRHHFGILKNPVGSTPEVYLSLIRFDPAVGGDQYFGRIGFLENERVRIPALLFLGEQTGASTMALYATFANRDPEALGGAFDPTEYSAISQYAYLALFRMLHEMGIACVNVGGSETEELDTFKRQLGARSEPSYWAVASPPLETAGPVNTCAAGASQTRGSQG